MGAYRGIWSVEEGGLTSWLANPEDDGQLVECPTRPGQKVAVELWVVSESDVAYEWNLRDGGVKIEVNDK